MAMIFALMAVYVIPDRTQTPFVQERLPWVYLLLALAILTYWMPLKVAATVGGLICVSSLCLHHFGTPAPTGADATRVFSTIGFLGIVLYVIALRVPAKDETPTKT